MRTDNLLILDVYGAQISGEGRPSTEFWIHARIYKARPDVQVFQAITPIRTRALGDAVARMLGSHSAMLLRWHGVDVAEKDVRRALRHDSVDGGGGQLPVARHVRAHASLLHVRGT